jgi:hypothetical protein
VTVDDYTYSVIVKPKIAEYIENMKYQQVTIKLTSDNSMVFEMHDVEKKTYSEAELKAMSKPSKFDNGEPSLKLWDILDIEYDPTNTFCFEVVLHPNVSLAEEFPILNTCTEFALQYKNLGIF